MMIKKITFLFLLCSSLAIYSQVDKKNTEPEIVDSSMEDQEAIPYLSVVEEIPIYPGCEDVASRNERKRCMSQNLRFLVNENFNMDLIQNLDIASGHHRILLTFKVNEKGIVESYDVRAPHPKLKEEGERVITLFPNMQPAKHQGKEIGVLYSIPLMIAIEGNDKRNKPKRG